MTLDQFLQHLAAHTGREAHRSGGQYEAICPAHEDRKASLSITEGDDGRILLKCFAGCEAESIVTALGLSMADLFPDRDFRSGPSFADRIVTAYDYRDESGNLLYQTVRLRDPKDFRQRRPDGQGGWVWNLDHTRRVLYRLPELLSADPAAWVLLPEGEKDVDRLVSLGLVSTTCPMGAGKWRDEYSKVLTNRRCCILPDHDEPGRKHAEQVAASLTRHGAAEVKVLTLPGLPDKGDVSDWLADGHTAADLLDLAEGAAAWTPPEEPSPAVIGGAAESKPTEPYHRTDLGNAQRLVQRHGQDLRYCWDWGRWLVWDGARWSVDATAEVFRRAKNTVTSIYGEAAHSPHDSERKELAKHAIKSESRDRLRAMVELAQSEPGIPIQPDDLDADPWLLNCCNGTLDLRTGALREHHRGDLLTKLVPVEYDPAAACPTWAKFLARIMDGNESLIRFLQRAIGYSLTGDTSEQCLFILHGVGMNGKTTFLNCIRGLWGDYAQQTATDTFLVKRFADTIPCDVADLKGVRLACAVEVDEGRRLAEGLIKQATGGEPLRARFLHQNFFEFDPVFKLWLGTNHRPIIRGTDNAIWRRPKLIPFNIVIPETEQDKSLPAKLRAEWPGLLAWAVEGCLTWQRNGLGVPDEVKQATAGYRAEMDVLAGFLEDCCIIHADAKASAKELYTAYTTWCEQNGERAEQQRRFGERLTERGFERYRGGVSGAYHWKGIGLHSLLDPPKDSSTEPSEPSEPKNGVFQSNSNFPYTTPKQGSEGSEGSEPNAPLFLAASQTWPAVSLGPGVTVGPGEAAWRTFAAKARPDVCKQVIAALRERLALEEGDPFAEE
jgi:putative DNA primase/helicase